MPFIEEEKLADLESKLENFNLVQEELEQEITNSQKETKNLNGTIRGLIILLFFLAVGLFVFGFLYFQTKKEKQSILLNHQRSIGLKVDSIQKIYETKNFSNTHNSNKHYNNINDVNNGLIYTIQIGAFKKYDLDKYPKEELINFRSMTNKEFNTYSIGKFKTLIQANNFLKEIRRIGIKDAFILPIKDGKRISLEKAKRIENS